MANANIKFSQLPSLGTMTDTTIVPVVAAGQNFTVTGDVIKTYIGAVTTPYGNANVAAYLPTYSGELVSLTGNVTTTAVLRGAFLVGDGSNIANIKAANIVGTVANATFATSAGTANSATTAQSATTAGSANTAVTVTANAQPAITSVGNLTALTVTGNITTTGGKFIGDGGLLTNVQVGAGSIIYNAASNVSIPTPNGNILMAVAGGLVGFLTPTTVGIGDRGLNGTYNQRDGAVAIGRFAGAGAGGSQGYTAVAVGDSAGSLDQGDGAIAIGYSSGDNSQGNTSIAIGYNAASNLQGISSIAIGTNSGANNQSNSAIAMGLYAGRVSQGVSAVAVGNSAGEVTQGDFAVAIGEETANTNQGDFAVAIGRFAGQSNQGANSIAIGSGAGVDNQPTNSIILNASGNTLNGSAAGFYVNPVRFDDTNYTNGVYYNLATKEVTYRTETPYGNAQVAAYLPNYTGNLTAVGNISASGNVRAANIQSDNYQYANGQPFLPDVGVTKITAGTGIIITPSSGIGNVVISSDGSSNTNVIAISSGTTNMGIATPSSNINMVVTGSAVANFSPTTAQFFANVVSPRFTGNGSALTGLTGSQITGAVALATLANTATLATTATTATTANTAAFANTAESANTANLATTATTANVALSINGANVVGAVANATFATSAGTATTATVANTANSVAAANIVGTVANATFATTAGTANVANTATFANTAGTANTAQTATTAVTATTATNATTAVSVSANAQPNITSVGTMLSLTASGNVQGAYIKGDGGLLSNTVTRINAGTNITVSGTTGNITISSTGGAAGTQLVNGNTFVKTFLDGNITLSSGNTANSNIGQLSTNTIQLGLTGSVTGGGPPVLQDGAIAIGKLAGQYSTLQTGAIAIGSATGRFGSVGNNSIAIGAFSATGSLGANSIAIGAFAGGNQNNTIGINSIVLNATGSDLSPGVSRPNSLTIAPIRNDLANIAQVLYYNTTTKEVTYAPPTGNGSGSGVTGIVAGANISISSTGANGTGIVTINATGNIVSNSIGVANSFVRVGIANSISNSSNIGFQVEYFGNTYTAGNIGVNGVSFGAFNNIGDVTLTSNVSTQSVALVNYGVQNTNLLGGISIGQQCNVNIQGVAVGFQANAGPHATAVGEYATATGNNAVALGGGSADGQNSLAIADAISGGLNSIAIGNLAIAGSFGAAIGSNAIAIGASSLANSNSSISIGTFAGSNGAVGANAIAIGSFSGRGLQGANSVVIGSSAGGNISIPVPTNSIIINATGANLDSTVANSFTVKPVRNSLSTNSLFYEPTSGEITYSALTYGSFSSNFTQSQVSANTAVAISYTTTQEASGVSITGLDYTRLTIAKAGKYNLQFSAQTQHFGGSTSDIYIWLRKNGVDVPDSASTVLLTNNSRTVQSWNFVFTAAAGDYYQIMWMAPDTGVQLLAQAAVPGGIPAIPSVIATIVPVGA